MDDIIKIIKTRRSIRRYSSNPIARNLLESLVDAARFAATARAVEPWEFVVITDRKVLKEIGGLAENARFMADAAACVAVFCSDTKYYLEDGCAATQNLLIAARAYGIGSCWVAGDKKPYCSQISRLLSVPDSFKLVSMVALGYPLSSEDFKVIDKRGIDQLTHWEKF